MQVLSPSLCPVQIVQTVLKEQFNREVGAEGENRNLHLAKIM